MHLNKKMIGKKITITLGSINTPAYDKKGFTRFCGKLIAYRAGEIDISMDFCPGLISTFKRSDGWKIESIK